MPRDSAETNNALMNGLFLREQLASACGFVDGS